MAFEKPCDTQRDLIQELVDGELPARERMPLERHLSECAACRAYRHGMAATAGELFTRLGAVLPEAPDLVAALGLPSAAMPLATAPVPVRRTRRRGAAWGAAVAGILLVVGLTGSLHPRAVAPTGLAAVPHAAGVEAVAASDVDAEDGKAILTWFGPETDDPSSEE